MFLIIHADAEKCIDYISHVPLLRGRDKVALQAEDKKKKAFLELMLVGCPGLVRILVGLWSIAPFLTNGLHQWSHPQNMFGPEWRAGYFYYKVVSIY